MFKKVGAGFKIVKNELVGDDLSLCHDAVGVGELILQALRSKPNHIGLVDGITGTKCTYNEMMEKSIKCAYWMRKQGIQPGDIVGACVGNIMDSYVPLFATFYINGIVNTWDEDLTITTARYFLSLTRPKIVFVNAHSAGSLREAAKQEALEVKLVVFEELADSESLMDVLRSEENAELGKFECTRIASSEDTCMICCSSGTTGLPKGTEISHFSLKNYMNLIDVMSMKDHIIICLPPVRWHYGLSVIVKAVLDYAPRIVIDHYLDTEILCQVIEKYNVSWLAAGPGVLMRMLKYNLLEKYRMPSLKLCLVGGSPFKAEHQNTARKQLPHVNISQTYGMTDVGGISTHQTADSKAGSCGPVVKGVRIKLVDRETERIVGPNEVGEIWVKSPYVMKGYYNNPESGKELIDQDGYAHSGDIGYYDEDGELFIVGRESEFIIYKSINVPPAQIESFLERHPAVLEAAVVGVAHEIDDELPMAFVRIVPGRHVSEQELIDLINKNLEYYSKLRGGLVFVNELPRTATGKLSRKKLKEIAQILWKQ